MKRNVLSWIVILLVLIIILCSPILPLGFGILAVSAAMMVDLWGVRLALLQLRMRLDQRGLELGQVIPSTLVIFIWLMYAVVHFLIFISFANFLNLPPAVLKWVFPLTVFKSLWPVYYLGSKLPVQKQENLSSNNIALQLPWAIGGSFGWYNSYLDEHSEWTLILYAIIIALITLLPSFFGFWIKRSV